MKQVLHRAGEMVLGWLLQLWDDRPEGTELSSEEMAQLASVPVILFLVPPEYGMYGIGAQAVTS